MIFLSIKDPLAPQTFSFTSNSPSSLRSMDKELKFRKSFQVKERKRLCWIALISVKHKMRLNLEDFKNKYNQLPKFYKLSAIFIHIFSVRVWMYLCANLEKTKSQGSCYSRNWLLGRWVQEERHMMLSRAHTKLLHCFFSPPGVYTT